MAQINDGGPAYPRSGRDAGEPCRDIRAPAHAGMTLRDWFAGQALASMHYIAPTPEAEQAKACAAYQLADAMLRARASQAGE